MPEYSGVMVLVKNVMDIMDIDMAEVFIEDDEDISVPGISILAWLIRQN